ncbi:MAG: D-glycero-beta-D-manno-heptose-7-phosphate kinase [Gemmatimonadetes bacterium]|nr:D-glycero-beta-D-manno-heptose-7-phosphate kinase [Gemmatimonadota bacterium]
MNRLSAQRVEELLQAARRVRVLVVGDIMLDAYLRGAALRISPEAPVPVVRIEEEWRALGGAANVATNVLALGAACDLAGVIGTDPAGAELTATLRHAGIDGRGLLLVPERPTTVKTRIMARHQQVARYDRELDEDLDERTATALVQRIAELATSCDAIVVEDYNKGVLTRTVIAGVLAAAHACGCPLVVDPKSRFFFDYQSATVFKPNLPELAAALREPVRFDDAGWMRATRAQLGCDHLLLTLGEHGMALLAADDELLRIPAVARSVYDVSGAGDTVTAVVAVALAAGASIQEAAVLANYAAAVEVGKAGVATVSAAELLQAVREQEAQTQETH